MSPIKAFGFDLENSEKSLITFEKETLPAEWRTDLRRSQEWTLEDSWEAIVETVHERQGWLGLDVALDMERSRWAWERFGRETGRIRSWARWEEGEKHSPTVKCVYNMPLTKTETWEEDLLLQPRSS